MATATSGTQEVTRTDITLEQAIETGAVSKPPLMGWNTWLAWRKKVGRRPHHSVDGSGTTPQFEAKLWRVTMASLYGEEWMVALAEQDGGHGGRSAAAAEPKFLRRWQQSQHLCS